MPYFVTNVNKIKPLPLVNLLSGRTWQGDRLNVGIGSWMRETRYKQNKYQVNNTKAEEEEQLGAGVFSTEVNGPYLREEEV